MIYGIGVDITKVSIRKEFQGMKLSNILMDDCLNRTGILGVDKINLEVRVNNVRAINLYKKYGFKELIVRKNYYGVGEDALIMVRSDDNE
jgi:ribosomal-protein-alanine N-acetyltransferase